MPAESQAVAAAALLGAAGGVRTMVPPAVLAISGRGPKGPARYALVAASLGEMATDKAPGVPARVSPPALLGRVAVAALSGRRLAGGQGAAIAATTAAVSTLGSWRARSELPDLVGQPDPVVAAAEDAIALSVAALAVRGAPAEDPRPEALLEEDEGTLGLVKDAARGVAAAVVGTVAMTGAQLLYYRLSGEEQSRAPEKVVRKLLKEGAGKKVPRKHRQKLNWAAHAGYGISWGLPLGLTVGRTSKGAATGLGFGAAVWVASLVELPSLDQAPPVWEMPPFHVALDAGFHLIYGAAAGATLKALS